MKNGLVDTISGITPNMRQIKTDSHAMTTSSGAHLSTKPSPTFGFNAVPNAENTPAIGDWNAGLAVKRVASA